MEIGCTKIQVLSQVPSPLQKEGNNFLGVHADACCFKGKCANLDLE